MVQCHVRRRSTSTKRGWCNHNKNVSTFLPSPVQIVFCASFCLFPLFQSLPDLVALLFSSYSLRSIVKHAEGGQSSNYSPHIANVSAEALTAYWDNLSKIFLTQSALDEFDRRAPRPRQIATEGQPGLKSGEITEFSTQSKHACRQGGLDLRHLRGVRYAQKYSRL